MKHGIPISRILRRLAGSVLRRRARSSERSKPLPAKYYYSVWLRHLVMAGINSLDTHPQVVVELGPGDALGLAVAALLSGVSKFMALDVMAYASPEASLRVLDDMLPLFEHRQPIPDQREFSKISPTLERYCFPDHVLGDARLGEALSPSRVKSIRESLANPDGSDRNGIQLHYAAPWDQRICLSPECVDAVCSQATMQYVRDPSAIYGYMHQWLKPGGWMSHEIDLKSHGMADTWDGHWAYSDLVWRLLTHKTPYYLNRSPCSEHIAAIRDAGFDVVCTQRTTCDPAIPGSRLAGRFRQMSPEDRRTSTCFVQAVKDGPPRKERLR